MKKCEKCGKEFEDSMQSCDACGGALTEEKPQETEEKTFCIYCGGEIAEGNTNKMAATGPSTGTIC